MLRIRRAFIRAVAFAISSAAWAQGSGEGYRSYPTKSVEIYVGAGVGTGSDTVARYFAEKLGAKTGQPFVVVNRAGLYGQLAVNDVKRAKPDGYVLMITPNSTLTVNPHLVKDASFDATRDLTPVSTLTRWGLVLVVNPKRIAATNVGELTAILKQDQGRRSYASGHYAGRAAGDLYRLRTGFDAVHVPYKSIPAAVGDLLGGQVDFLFADTVAALPHIRSGRLRALAVTSPRRIAALPEVPTMTEAGVSNFEIPTSWFAVLLPPKAPVELTQRLADLFNGIMDTPETRDFFQRITAEAYPGNPEQLVSLIRRETLLQGELIKSLGIEKFE